MLVEELRDESILCLTSHPVELPSYLSEEYFQESAEVRKAQMLADGFIEG